MKVNRACQTDDEKELSDNLVNEGAFIGATAVLLEKMTRLTLHSLERDLVGANKTREVVEVVSRGFYRWQEVAQAIQTVVNVQHDLREMTDEMLYYSRKLDNIHECRSNIRRVRRWLRFHVPFIVLFTIFAFCLAVIFGAVDFCWDDIGKWSFYYPFITFVLQPFFYDTSDRFKTSDFEETLPLLAEALHGLGETYRKLRIAADVRTRDQVAINKILQAQGYQQLAHLSHNSWHDA
ncbi:hypothetical protein FB45DRAFT_949303 [Roridomyces roridus]|uniref:Uncharacterized protein n=1 Tax=Roridomyces roridus TaxID=1738132 RepID=A0AAD7B0Q5_9AGAR|nr:hypothetical protein FB45DRAFT_949303 [Roridomyces roridus]